MSDIIHILRKQYPNSNLKDRVELEKNIEKAISNAGDSFVPELVQLIPARWSIFYVLTEFYR